VLTDAHCHPFNLAEDFPAAETERRQLGVMCAASATSPEEFVYCEQLTREAKDDKVAPLLPCFAVHPQMPLMGSGEWGGGNAALGNGELGMVETLASEGRLGAVGETGFDLFNAAFRETEKVQDELFAVHLETALRYDLPLVLHVRRAMHKIFAFSSALKKCRAVIFHSWPGTLGEGEALLRRGINVFFSFGNIIMLNHREAIRCCSLFPVDRLLTETDAPFQPLRGKQFSTYADLRLIVEGMSALRGEGISPEKMEKNIEDNFHRALM
jgi:TatD DNase family protein